MKKDKKSKTYIDRVHTWGRVWSLAMLFVLLSVPLSICVYFNVWPEANLVFRALASVVPLYWGTTVVEVFTYTPMLGAGATYVSFVSGNISNLKLPCGLNAMENAHVKANSEEGEVISTISIGVSSIVTTVIIAVGVLAFTPFLSVITDPESVLSPAFTYVLPALFGALGAGFFRKHWKISVFPILVGMLVLVFAPTLPVGTLMFATLIASCGGALLMIKLEKI